jgi:hypothetical protein
VRLQCLLCILLEAAGEGQHCVQIPYHSSLLLLLLVALLQLFPVLQLLLLLWWHLQQHCMIVPHNKPV